MIAQLPPIPVAGSLAIAGLLLVTGAWLPRKTPDVVAVLTALAAAAICVVMAMHTAAHPLVYWFGGWTPRNGQVIGIGFVVDQAGAAMGAFIGLLFAATILFAWSYYDEVHAHFHVLMLLFMAGMIGFCLTHDLFNLFVWFEVMSVAGFALTGYALRTSALEGALNFTIVNTIGAYLILGGIGLIYAQVGALDFGALSQGVAAAPNDPVIMASFGLIAAGMLIKAAQVPFQFWLADAHAVAPSPVSVIFSGAMVALGLFGIARLYWSVFALAPEVHAVMRTLVLGMGMASAVVGGIMSLVQRHAKRLLAFSTISHVGVMLVGLALLDRSGLAGMFVYMIGHGLVKGALFMIAGIMLALLAGVDEIRLRGAGRRIWPVGVVVAFTGLLLAGLPVGLMDEGIGRIRLAAQEEGELWVMLPVLVGTVCTGAAVLRLAGRVFAGWGPVSDEAEREPSDEEREKDDRPLWLMLLPTLLLLGLSLVGAGAAGRFASRAAAAFMVPSTPGLLGLRALPSNVLVATPEPPSSVMPWISVVLAMLLAGYGLNEGAMPPILRRAVSGVLDRPLLVLRLLHSGLVGDYVTWLVAGLALFAVAFAWS